MTEREFGLAAIDDIIRDSVMGRERYNIRWESFSDEFIDAIKTAKVYVDCGAEYGFYIRLALKYGPTDIKILAFEPEPIRFELLKLSLQGSPNVTILPYAVADKERNNCNLFKMQPGYSSSFFSEGDSFEAHAISLDSLFDHTLYMTKPDVIKMDIEGAEDLAFIGMQNVLKNKPKLFVEFHPHPNDPQVRPKTSKLLKDAGYIINGSIDCGRVAII